MSKINGEDEITTLLQNKCGAGSWLERLRDVSVRMQSIEWQLAKRNSEESVSEPGKSNS
ncbi:MAG: hypothetical protein H7039_21020 [Bryobacteraceae bacterium]|nr:hypothetical protein [Bryobacteraceae bacterium]